MERGPDWSFNAATERGTSLSDAANAATSGAPVAVVSAGPITRVSGGAGRAIRRVWAAGRDALRRPQAPLALFVTACMLTLMLGTLSSLTVLNLLDAQAAERDAMTHVRAIQTLLQNGGYLQVPHLQQAQAHLQVVADDVRRIQTNGALGLPLVDVAGASGIRHVVAMAADLVAAGQAGLDAAQILVPHTGDIFKDLGNPTTNAAPTLAPQDVARISDDLSAATRYAQLALAERAAVHDDDLRRIGLGGFLTQLHQLDALAPALTTDLGYARGLVHALPALLGLSAPARFLLLNLDSDELRPGGGFAGNYAILTLSGGHLQGGVQLHDIYTLDCPSGCPLRRVPATYSWFDLAPTQFGLRDANLDPDFPQSARLLEDLLAQEGGPPVDGVVTITPAVIEAMLQVTGPITVPEYNRSVSATDLQDVIHYYHLTSGTGLSDTPSGRPYGTTDRKVFDALLGKDVLHAVATLSPDKQRAVATIALHALQTRDVQIYLNNAEAQQVFTQLGLDGAVATPAGGDSLLVVDANVGVTYANADIGEQAADTVTLDAQGTATHAATITYTYAKRTHLYDAAYVAAGGGWYYRDFARVIVPAGARLVSGSGCAWKTVTQTHATAWGCLFTVRASQTVTLHLSWSVPSVASFAAPGPGSSGSAASTSPHPHAYQLYWQRQVGSLITASATFQLPAGARLKQPVAPPLSAAAGAGQVSFTGQLSQSQTLVLDRAA